MEIIKNPYNLSWSVFLGVLGAPGELSLCYLYARRRLLNQTVGKTAFAAWKEYSQAKKVALIQSYSSYHNVQE